MDIPDAPDLLNQHRRLTARLARHIGRGEAEDLASEAMTRGLFHPAPDGRRAAWIERIFRNLVVDRGRRRSRAAARLSRIPEAPSVPNPEDLLIDHQRRGALVNAMPRIPPALRQVLMARFYEDRDYDGIAAALGITPATARTRVHRALGRLRIALGRLGTFFPVPFPLPLPLPWSTGLGVHAVPVTFLPAMLSLAVVIPSATPDRIARPESPVPAFIAQASPATAVRRSPPPSRTIPVTAPPPPLPSPRPPAAARSVQPVPAKEQESLAVKRYDFENDDIEGELKRPHIEHLVGDAPEAVHSSLIEVPRSFVPAIGKMLEDL
ncbi:MAG: sigma-70 family RNA polymerase sigma factor [Deltaproteobacteria bacterium]|nr:sigma-70 family RNA polymerase sigma factor [Deltaproteobacteria bacterium]